MTAAASLVTPAQKVFFASSATAFRMLDDENGSHWKTGFPPEIYAAHPEWSVPSSSFCTAHIRARRHAHTHTCTHTDSSLVWQSKHVHHRERITRFVCIRFSNGEKFKNNPKAGAAECVPPGGPGCNLCWSSPSLVAFLTKQVQMFLRADRTINTFTVSNMDVGAKCETAPELAIVAEEGSEAGPSECMHYCSAAEVFVSNHH